VTDRAAAVVVSYNSRQDLPSCLEGLLEARSLATVIVVDNGSVDGSGAAVRECGDRRVTIFELATNTGFAGGCNRGFAALPAGIPYVAFMNPDVVVEPDCLHRCVDVLEARPDIAGVAPLLMRPDGTTVDSVGQVLRPYTLEVRDRGYGEPMTEGLRRPTQVLAACGALAVYRRDALENVAGECGPWAEHYFCFWEDLELGWRLTNRGWKLMTAPDAVAVHGRGAGAAGGAGRLRWRRPPELEACVLSNRWMTLIRHLHSLDALRRLPLLLMWDKAVLAVSCARRPRLLVHLKRRWPLVYREWRCRERVPRRRLSELPW
jgi:GT2 family glycosyltransferase